MMLDVPTGRSTDCSLPPERSGSVNHNIEYLPAMTAVLVLVSDLLAVLFVTYFAPVLQFGAHPLRWPQYAALFTSTALVVQVTFGYFELYNFETLYHPADYLPKIAAGSCLGLPVIYLGALSISRSYSLTSCCSFILLLIGVLYAERWTAYTIIRSLARLGLVTRNAVIIGCGSQCERLVQVLCGSRRPWTRILGSFHDCVGPIRTIKDCPWLGTSDSLIDFARRVRVDDVFLALPRAEAENVRHLLDKLRVLAVNVHFSTGLPDPLLRLASLSRRDDVPAFRLTSKPLDGWRSIVKTTEDKMVATLALLLLLPILALVAIAIRLDSPGPVLFRQRRFGRNNQIIRIYKFRTMFNDQRDDDAEQLTTKDDPRVTPLGRFLRRTCIDELPQLFNVLKGDMSVIGPRPHAIKAKSKGALYSESVARYAERHKIKPGMTGWAQVNGLRGDTECEEALRLRVEFDIYYLEHWSVLFDIGIMLRTPFVIFSGKGAY